MWGWETSTHNCANPSHFQSKAFFWLEASTRRRRSRRRACCSHTNTQHRNAQALQPCKNLSRHQTGIVAFDRCYNLKQYKKNSWLMLNSSLRVALSPWSWCSGARLPALKYVMWEPHIMGSSCITKKSKCNAQSEQSLCSCRSQPTRYVPLILDKQDPWQHKASKPSALESEASGNSTGSGAKWIAAKLQVCRLLSDSESGPQILHVLVFQKYDIAHNVFQKLIWAATLHGSLFLWIFTETTCHQECQHSNLWTGPKPGCMHASSKVILRAGPGTILIWGLAGRTEGAAQRVVLKSQHLKHWESIESSGAKNKSTCTKLGKLSSLAEIASNISLSRNKKTSSVIHQARYVSQS